MQECNWVALAGGPFLLETTMTQKRTIPQIAERLRELAEFHGIDELNQLADETRRKPPVRKASAISQKMTPELAEEIRTFAKHNPAASFTIIGRHFQVNIGRVSEALNEAA
jgi:hypothetical protein